jgi:putative transposase
VIRRQAYKFQLKTNGAQARQMRGFAGACRFVFNQALALQKARYEAGSKKLGYAELCTALLSLKNSNAWLNASPSQTLQQALKDLECAYKNFFAKRADFPRFKKKGLSSSFRFPQGCKLDQTNHRIFLPKLGWMHYRNSREVLGEIKNVTVSNSCGQWTVSIQTEREVSDAIHPSTTAVGIDMGIAQFATLSDGYVFAAVNSFKQKQNRLARYQRALSRKVKFSSNWKQQRNKIGKLHQTIANIRRDYLHKTTTLISQNHALIVIEDLQVKNMSKSASGDLNQPGRNVKAKSGLNRSILDQGWFEFRRQLEYKQNWAGGEVIAVPPQYTSQRCSCCGSVSKENRKTQAKFACIACGYQANADVNAAMNILAAGHAVIACGEVAQSGASVKQEPAESTTCETSHV